MNPKLIFSLVFIISFMLSGCASSARTGADGAQITNGTMEALFNKAVISSGSNFVECERQLLAADDSVLATMQTNLRNSDPIARLLAQVLLDGKKGRTNDYNKAAEYLEWLMKRAPVSEGGPPSPPMLAHSLAKAFDGRVADFLALRLVKEEKENLPGWLRTGTLLYLQQQKSPATTAALLRFALETDDEHLRDSAIEAIKGIRDPELPKKLEAEREYAKKQHLQLPSVLETLQNRQP
jgi:hypothetical protein